MSFCVQSDERDGIFRRFGVLFVSWFRSGGVSIVLFLDEDEVGERRNVPLIISRVSVGVAVSAALLMFSSFSQ